MPDLYAKIRHDRECWINCETNQLVENARHDDPCFSRKFSGNYAYPAVFAFWVRPKGGGDALPITPAWWEYVKSINTEDGWRVLRRNNGGWINFASNPDYGLGAIVPDPPNPYPRVERVVTTWNYVKVLERKNGSSRIETFMMGDPPPGPEVNPETYPWLYEYPFRAIGPDGTISLAPNGVFSVFPRLTNDEAWIPDEYLEFGVNPIEEEPVPMPEPTQPLWRDYSRYQGTVNFDVAKDNGVKGVILRAGISWGFQDPMFQTLWDLAGLRELYRSSYHVIYTDQPIVDQADNWYAVHPERDVIPRVIDLEVDRGDPPEAKAEAVAQMSDLVLSRDGERPWIYSRYLLVNDWLSTWASVFGFEKQILAPPSGQRELLRQKIQATKADKSFLVDLLRYILYLTQGFRLRKDPWLKAWTVGFKNQHYWWMAQYLLDRATEHPGPPTLPNGVLRERVVLQQTADKKAGFPGEVQSAAVDWDRWQLGDEQQMIGFIADTWGGAEPPPPPPPPPPPGDTILKAEVLTDVESIQVALDVLRGKVTP